MGLIVALGGEFGGTVHRIIEDSEQFGCDLLTARHGCLYCSTREFSFESLYLMQNFDDFHRRSTPPRSLFPFSYGRARPVCQNVSSQRRPTINVSSKLHSPFPFPRLRMERLAPRPLTSGGAIDWLPI